MTAIASPFKITYGSQAVGGASGVFQILGPHSLSKSFDTLTLEFTVVVVGTSYADLQNQSNTLEAAFMLRDKTLIIDLDNVSDPAGSSIWTYTTGQDILNVHAELSKTGDEETDRGYSRSYQCTITGGLPSDDVDGSSLLTGLRDISYTITYLAGRQQRVAIQGVYTATAAQTSPSRAAKLARANYEDSTTGADVEAAAYLAALTGTFELIAENVDEDRTNHLVQFSRTYIQILDDQTQAATDAANIRDHSFRFSEQIDQPGDSAPDVFRLRRVVANYDCAIDIDQSVDILDVFQDEVRPHIIALFQTAFTPAQFCVESRQVTYDRTGQRLAAQLSFLYQKSGGDDFVEFSAVVTHSIQRTLDVTPVHERSEFAAEVDAGWATRTRTKTFVSVILGDKPQTSTPGQGGAEGGGGGPVAEGGGGGGLPPGFKPDDNKLIRAGLDGFGDGGSGGWEKISSERQASTSWIGDPDEDMILVTKLDEQVVEQYFESPSGGGGGSNYTPGGTRKPTYKP